MDFPPEDPINIMKHLMIGSEGTLGFISSITYNTVEEMPRKVGVVVWVGGLEDGVGGWKGLSRRRSGERAYPFGHSPCHAT